MASNELVGNIPTEDILSVLNSKISAPILILNF